MGDELRKTINLKSKSLKLFLDSWASDNMLLIRKKKDLSQAELGRMIGTSGDVVGRYERNEVLPSVEVAKKIADALEVSLDYLAGEGSQATVDKQTMKLIHDIEELEPAIKDKLFFLANAVIRDAKTKKAYTH